LNQLRVDTEVHIQGDSRLLEASFKQLWDKIRAATELISQLREMNQKYHSQVENLEGEIIRLRSGMSQKEHDMKRLKLDHAQLSGALGNNDFLTIEEKEALKSKIKDIIAKINSHL